MELVWSDGSDRRTDNDSVIIESKAKAINALEKEFYPVTCPFQLFYVTGTFAYRYVVYFQ